MSFLDIRFPTGISYGASGGPGYSTDVVILNSGHEQRNQNWSAARCTFDVARAVKTDALRTALITFFRIAKGRAHSFRFRDQTDYEVSTSEGVLSIITATTYQLKKRYTNAAGTEDRTITLPVSAVIKDAGGVTLRDGIDYNLALTTGVVTIIGSPTMTPASWSGEFDLPCRFDTDTLRMVAEDIDLFRSQSIPIVEVRV